MGEIRDSLRAHALRRSAVAVVAALLLAFAASGAAGEEGGNDGNEGRDTQSRHEMPERHYIALTRGGGLREDIRNIVVIQTRFIAIKQTRFGIDFENLDRVDVSEVPLLGSLFGRPLRADDLNDGNRVGTVYSTGNGSLVAFIGDEVAVDDSGLGVVNGKYRATPTGSWDSAAASTLDLGDLGELPSVRQAANGQAPEATTTVLRGLTATSLPEVQENSPVLADVPLLRQFFRGSVHDYDDELILFIRPSIIAGDGAE
ncbi:hypothetical protein AAFN88_03640 [Pelagibius sp. CAU 1746]|uniref:hypothetical protein n=1 Tax=Pelagibius sp. CAU 1746 TaxID=3140370 RepID=UPI00325BCADF